MGGCDLERDDVNALADAMDVAGIGWVPDGGEMTLVGLRSKEQFERHICGRGRVGEERVGLIMRLNVGAQLA